MTAPDDVATPKRMTPKRRAEIETWTASLGPGAPSMLSCCKNAVSLLAELRAVEAQLAEARRALEAVREVADRRLREQNPYAEREEMGRIADVALAKLDADGSG